VVIGEYEAKKGGEAFVEAGGEGKAGERLSVGGGPRALGTTSNGVREAFQSNPKISQA
jgi:hypothetical protein